MEVYNQVSTRQHKRYNILKIMVSHTYSRSSIIRTAMAKIYRKGVQISEFVQISEAKPNILDTAVPNFLYMIKRSYTV